MRFTQSGLVIIVSDVAGDNHAFITFPLDQFIPATSCSKIVLDDKTLL